MRRLAALLLLTAAATSTAEVQVSGSEDSCTAYCKETFKPHTSQLEAGQSTACATGCRLSTLARLTDGRLDDADVRGACESSCAEAYSETESRQACDKGCATQVPQTGPQHVEMVISSVGKPIQDGGGIFTEARRQLSNFFGGSDPFAAMEREMAAFRDRLGLRFGPSPVVDYPDNLRPPLIAKEPPPFNSEHAPLGNTAPDGSPIVFVQLEPVNMGEGKTSANARFEDANTLSSLFEGAHEPSPPALKQPSRPSASHSREAATAADGERLLRRALLCLALALSAFVFVWLAVSALRTAPRRRLAANRSEALAKLAAAKMSPRRGAKDEKLFLVPNEVIHPPPPPYDSGEPATLHASAPLRGDKETV